MTTWLLDISEDTAAERQSDIVEKRSERGLGGY